VSPRGTRERAAHLRQMLWWRRRLAPSRRTPGSGRSLACYPEAPHPTLTVIVKICAQLGVRLDGRDADLDAATAVLRFEDVTVSGSDPILDQVAARRQVLNYRCTDISKSVVDAAWAKVSGRPTAVDPLTHVGAMVVKSETNALHDGRIVTGPLADREPGVFYQRLIDNTDGNEVIDLRVPIVGGTCGVVYIKRRPIDDRFSNENTSVELALPTDVFSADEIAHIDALAVAMGLDYGELDVLRDRTDGHIAVVDVNKTPYGPPNHLPLAEQARAVRILADAVDAAWFS
jgi:hypothetical protein